MEVTRGSEQDLDKGITHCTHTPVCLPVAAHYLPLRWVLVWLALMWGLV
jgi:hypothetical protein